MDGSRHYFNIVLPKKKNLSLLYLKILFSLCYRFLILKVSTILINSWNHFHSKFMILPGRYVFFFLTENNNEQILKYSTLSIEVSHRPIFLQITEK